jgi:hypothetical protein
MDFVAWIARRVVPLCWRVLVVGLLLLWYAPWFVLAAVRGAFRFVRAIPWRWRSFVAASRDTVRCSRCGREQSLLRRWRCPICKATESTYAWAPCSICGARYPAGYILCEDPLCAEAIPNPLLRGWL